MESQLRAPEAPPCWQLVAPDTSSTEMTFLIHGLQVEPSPKYFLGFFFLTLPALNTELWDVRAVCPSSSALAFSQLAQAPNAWILLFLLLLLQTSSSQM